MNYDIFIQWNVIRNYTTDAHNNVNESYKRNYFRTLEKNIDIIHPEKY